MITMEQFMEVVSTLSGDEVVELWNEFCDDEDRIISDKEFNSGMATFYSGEPILSILQDFAGESFDPWAKWFRCRDWQGWYSDDNPLDLLTGMDIEELVDRINETDILYEPEPEECSDGVKRVLSLAI